MHNALGDVIALQKVIHETGHVEVLISSHSFTISSAENFYAWSRKTKQDTDTFTTMILAKHISAQMARKCAGSGLLLKHLDIAYKRNGLQGIYNLLSEPCANKPL